jgi:hypothetical protein
MSSKLDSKDLDIRVTNPLCLSLLEPSFGTNGPYYISPNNFLLLEQVSSSYLATQHTSSRQAGEDRH